VTLGNLDNAARGGGNCPTGSELKLLTPGVALVANHCRSGAVETLDSDVVESGVPSATGLVELDNLTRRELRRSGDRLDPVGLANHLNQPLVHDPLLIQSELRELVEDVHHLRFIHVHLRFLISFNS